MLTIYLKNRVGLTRCIMERKILDGMDLTIYQTGKGDRLARISHNFSSAED